MFQFADANHVEIVANIAGCVEGRITKRLPYVRERKGYPQEGALAVRAESVTDFMNYLDATKDREGARDSSSRELGYGSWNTFQTWDEAVDTCRNNPNKVRKFEEQDKDIKSPDGWGNEVQYDVTGDYIDMGRFVEEQPECFGENVLGNPKGLFATIVINLAASASFEGAALDRRGQRIQRMVDWLERQHIRCEVVAFTSHNCAHVEVVVKKAEEPLNLDTLAVAGCGDFYRRFQFRVVEMSDTFTMGHGTSTTIHQGSLTMPPIEGHGIIVFCENHPSVYAVDAAYDRAEDQIAKAIEDGTNEFSVVA